MTAGPDDQRHRVHRTREDLRDRRLLRRYAETRDPELRVALAERFLPMARHLALRVSHGPEPLDDLVQVACIGLLKALDRYDPARGVAFSSFAVPTIHGELRRHFRDRTWAVRPPRDLQELTLRVRHVAMELTSLLDRSPTVGELATAVGTDESEVLEALQAARARFLPSLDAPLGGGEDGALVLHDRVGRPDPQYRAAEARVEIERLLRVLTPRERAVVRLRFELDLTQKDIGARLGLSQMHISRVLKRALDKLRAVSGAPEDAGAPAGERALAAG